MSADGTWNITVQTPMGAQDSTVELVSDGSALTGTQSGNGESGPIYDGSVDGDTISGTARAGAFPPSPFKGARA